jgi:uncharacterized protein YjbI with pentapeptide repeats
MAKSMYEIIKNQNGERFAKAIRNYDNGIFDIPDIDKIVKYAGRDAEPIMNYLVSLKQIKIQEMSVHMDPITLLDRAGYDAYIADTLEKQNAIRKYYACGEELCTFRDDDRFKKYYIINAVRKDVDKIKRGKPPQRDDEYGTSVISIQVFKEGGFISIKNRYNHTVQNCDNTLNSNPDNIILGLSDAIKHHFHVDFSAQHVSLPSHYVLMDGQICRYNSEILNVYFGEDFYAKDGQVHEIDKNSEIMIGNGILFDIRNKNFIDLTGLNSESARHRFVMALNNAIQSKKITVQKNPLGGRDILADGTQLMTVENGEIVNINLPGKQDVILLENCSKLRGEMDFSQVSQLLLGNADLSAVDNLVLPKKAKLIDIQGAKLPKCELDLSGVTKVFMERADIRHVDNFKLSAGTLWYDEVVFPKCELDFSAEKVSLNGADLSRVTNITFSPNVKEMFLRYVKLPKCELNFPAKKVCLNNADLSRVTNITFLPNTTDVDLSGALLPNVDLDLSHIEKLNLRDVDMRGISNLKLPKSYERLSLIQAKLPAIDLDLRNGKDTHLEHADLSRVTDLKLPKIEKLNLEHTVFPAINLDLSHFRGVYLRYSDLSRVTGLKLPKKAEFLNLAYAKLPAIDLDFSGVKYVHLDKCDLSCVTGLKGANLQDMLRWGTDRLKHKIKQTVKRERNVQNTNEADRR